MSASAAAQVTVTAPDVVEGETATITVTGKASIHANTAATTVTLQVTAASDTDGVGTENDVSQNLGDMVSLRFPANDTTEAVTSTQSATLTVQTHHDADAEDETIALSYNLGSVGTLEPSVSGSRFALLCRERHDEKSYSRRTFRRMLTRAGFQVTAETGILFVPWWRRMLDLACYTWARPLSRFTGLAVAPFQHLSLPSGTSQWPRRVGVPPARAAGESTARRHRTDRLRAASALDAHVGTVMASPGHPCRGSGRSR